MNPFKSKSLNEEIHDNLFNSQYLSGFNISSVKFSLPSIPESGIAFCFIKLQPSINLPIYFSLEQLKPLIIEETQQFQKELFVQNQKNQSIMKLSEFIRKLNLHSLTLSQDEIKTKKIFLNRTLQNMFENINFDLHYTSQNQNDSEYSSFIKQLNKAHSREKINIPFFIGNQKDLKIDSSSTVTLKEYIDKFFNNNEKEQETNKYTSLSIEKKEMDYQFLMITLEYEFNMGNKRMRDLKSMIEEEMTKVRGLSTEKKNKVYLKFAKYMLSNDFERIEDCKKVLLKALNHQKENYKLNHFLGLLYYKEIENKTLNNEKKDKNFLKLAADAIKFFIKSIYFNSNLTRKFIIQGNFLILKMH